MMARSRSRSASRPYENASKSTKAVSNQKAAALSPSRRRVTRSQSREPDVSDQKGDAGTGQPSTNAQRWKQNMGRKGPGLDAVVEESPAKSPAKSPRKSGARLENHAMLDSTEDAANISGTTILPSEPDTDLDPEMMLESLPDLERTARDILKLLVPPSTDPVSIVNLASKLADPKNTQSRRLSRSKSKFESEASYFGNQPYLDTERISETIYAALENKRDGLATDWTPDLIVQKANCARFAIQVLLARAKTGAPRQAIQHVEGLFPSVFMGRVVHDGQRPAVGESSLGKDTFNLALEIRTQYLIGSMEEQQDDPEFDPDALLKEGFFVDEIDEDIYDSSEAPLRGFNLDNLGGIHGYLPSRYRDAAYDRFNEMRVLVADGLDELKSSFRWSRFALKAAQWLCKRNDEIDRQLNRQRQADDLKDEFFATPRSARRLSSIPPRSEATQSPSRTSARPSSVAAENQKRMAARGSPFMAAPTKLRLSSTLSESESRGVSDTQNPLFTVPPIPPRTSDAQPEADDARPLHTGGTPTKEAPINPNTPDQPVNQPEPATAPEIRERRKSKSLFLNVASMNRLMQRRRRMTDSAQFSSQVEGDTLVSEGQGDVVPAASQSRTAKPVAPAAPTEPVHIPEPLPNSPLFMPQDDDFLSADTTGFTLDEDTSRDQIERSHSPPVRSRIRKQPRRKRSDSLESIPVNRSQGLPSDRELWQVATKHAASASTSDTRRDKHPRAAFIDHQENAHRVSPISHVGASSQRTRFAPPPSTNKRRREESPAENEDEDQESEAGFTRDTRTVDISRKRAEKPAQQPANKRQRTTNDDEDQAQETKQPRKASSTVPYLSSLPPSSQRSRVGWTEPEDNRLIRLIRDFSTKWSIIEQENQSQPERPDERRFEGRGQVQIKDRARNLKIAFYRNGKEQPKNFEFVTVSKKDKERLVRAGHVVE